jgi:transcriptional regulator with XRE-family HTH domain
MRLAEKLRHLREIEGQLRGRGRPLSKTEVVSLMKSEIGESLSLPYLSQIESGARPHLTASSRELLARFFRVHPSYLVGDPDGYEETLSTPVESLTPSLTDWLVRRAEEQRADPELYEALLRLASEPDPRATLIALGHALAEHQGPTPVRAVVTGGHDD